MQDAILGVADQKTISSIHGPCLAFGSKEDYDDSDSLMTLTAYYDTYISRFADFQLTMTTTTTMIDGQTDYFIPCACVRGNDIISIRLIN